MQSLNDDERKAVLGEILADELKVIAEYVKDIPQIRKDVEEIKGRLTNVESDVKVIKAAVTDQNHQLNRHDQRLTRLEAA
jgi:hypothetical protein